MIKQLKFSLQANSIHGIDSPLVYAFCENVVEDNRRFYLFEQAAALHQHNSKQSQQFSPLKGQRLFKSVLHFQPQHILLAGQDPLATFYLSQARSATEIYGIQTDQVVDNCPPDLQQRHVPWLAFPTVSELPLRKIDLLYIAACCTPTEVEALLAKTRPFFHPLTVIIIDNIHEKPERAMQWQQLKQLAFVRCSIELYNLGYLLLDEAFQQIQHFRIVRHKARCWQLGLFR